MLLDWRLTKDLVRVRARVRMHAPLVVASVIRISMILLCSCDCSGKLLALLGNVSRLWGAAA